MTADGVPTPTRYLAISSVSIGALLVMIDSSIAAVALPTIAQAFDIPASKSVLVITVYQLVLAATIIPFSALGDRVGQRRLFLSAFAVFAIAASACLLAQSFAALLVIRAVQALCSAAALSVLFGLIRSIYPARLLGRGLGLNTLSAAGGGALAPAAGGLILTFAPWPWVFAAGAPLAVLTLLAGRSLPELRVQKHHRFDLMGSALCAATLGLAVVGLGELGNAAREPATWLMLIAATVLGHLFVQHQRKSDDPVLPLDLLERPSFALAVSGLLAGVLASSSVLYSLPFRLHGQGFGAGEIGAMIAPFAVASVMFGPTAGMLTDRIAPARLGACGLTIAIIALGTIAFLPLRPSYFDVAWRLWLCGAGFALYMAPSARLALNAAPPHRSAAAGSIVNTTRMLGQALAATLVGALLALGAGEGALPAGIGAAFAAGAALCLALQPPRKLGGIQQTSHSSSER